MNLEGLELQGGLVTGSFIERLRQDDAPGTQAKDYDVPGRLEDRITTAWNELQNAWQLFAIQKARIDGSKDEAYRVTRDQWIRYLFDTLRYGHLTEEKPKLIESKSYPIKFSYQGVPIQVVSFSQDLDKGPDGTARGNPHSQLQEYINRAQGTTWGILTNGHKWRILRDNAASTRVAYIEFNLEAIMGSGEEESGRFDVFGLFWRVAHSSRITGESPWLEKWMREADRQGIRALEGLRTGVTDAIEILGAGFLKHPKNNALHTDLQSGKLSDYEFYHQVLRLVYRLLFLFVTEDRRLLLDPESSGQAKKMYHEHYSTERLRRFALSMRGSQHHDLFEALKVVMDGLKDAEGCPSLAIPSLNSALWSNEFIPHLDRSHIRNLHLLRAIRKLARIKVDKTWRKVDFKNLGSEELGGVYESLLELNASVDLEGRRFFLTAASGSERKTTGSYYTPDSIIQVILDHALDPLLDEACSEPDPEQAILSLKICDPTCGSGHFLIAAAHRIAKRFAVLRTGELEPGHQEIREALRHVVAHCLYGVDINPMAVELCKVSLWLEAMVPGKPLTFLEHKIQVGNAVIGATPLLLRNRLPDSAFKPIEGDDKEACKKYKTRNKSQTLQQVTLHGFKGVTDPDFHDILVQDIQAIEAIHDDDVTNIQEKETRLEQHNRSKRFAKNYADAWTAAFLQIKQPDDPYVITQETLNQILEDPNLVAEETWQHIFALRDEYRFFHWHLAFPEIIKLSPKDSPNHYGGGFDLILGNPPWDALAPDEKVFFSNYKPEFATSTVAEQKNLLTDLLAQPDIRSKWDAEKRGIKAACNFILNSGRYSNFKGGKHRTINIFRPVVEHGLQAIRNGGYYGQVLPESFYKSVSGGTLRTLLFEETAVSHLAGFVNSNGCWFPGIDVRTKFCAIVACNGHPTTGFRALFDLTDIEPTLDREAWLEYPLDFIHKLSPDDLQIMEVPSQADINIALKMYSRCPPFGTGSSYYEEPRPYGWDIHMGNQRSLFRESGELPLLEGKMMWLYDYRAAAYRGGRVRASSWDDLPFGSAEKSIKPQWYIDRKDLPKGRPERIKRYRAVFRDVTNPENERCFAAAVVPPDVACGHKIQTLVLKEDWMPLIWTAVANSIPMDWVVRPKVALTMSYSIIDTLPFPNLSGDHPLTKEIVSRAAQLICPGPEMKDLWAKIAQQGFVSEDEAPIEDPDGRLRIECQIHAIVAREIYGLTRDEFEYQFGRFDVLQRKDVRRHGHFRTKDWSLEAYDEISDDFPSATVEELWGSVGEEGAKINLAKGQTRLIGKQQARLG